MALAEAPAATSCFLLRGTIAIKWLTTYICVIQEEAMALAEAPAAAAAAEAADGMVWADAGAGAASGGGTDTDDEEGGLAAYADEGLAETTATVSDGT